MDILRGMTVCLMIIVNNGVGRSFPFLRHAQWDGMTPCDMVFPFFLFIMGVSLALASSKSIGKILKRTALIILVCWGIFWFDCILSGDWLPFEHFRLTGVLVRIALAYCVVALLARKLSPKAMGVTAAVLLVVYAVMLLLGNGYVNDETSIVAKVDLAVPGRNHLYRQRPVDPEGLLGLIPSVAHAIIGFLCGLLLKSDRPAAQKTARMAACGAALLALGLVVSVWLPLNKTIWSPSFVLVTCGSAAILLSLLSLLLDGKETASEGSSAASASVSGPSDRPPREKTGFFRVFGVNPLALYALSEVLAVVCWHFSIPRKAYQLFQGFLPPAFASLLYALLFMLVCWSVGLLLYKKKIYIKL